MLSDQLDDHNDKSYDRVDQVECRCSEDDFSEYLFAIGTSLFSAHRITSFPYHKYIVA